MEQFIYAEYALGSVNNRNLIQDISTFKTDSKEGYRSIFLFDESLKEYVKRTKTVTGFSGKHISDFLLFDFDGENLEEVRNEVLKFCLYLYYEYELPTNYLRVSFSGNKGFHVGIPFSCFTNSLLPKNNFYQIYKNIAQDLAKDFRFVDAKIYELKRLFRITNTINSKSGLYKIPLYFDELENLCSDEIKELAKSKRTIEELAIEEIEILPLLQELYQKWNRASLEHENKPKAKEVGSLLNGVSEGNRNDSAIKLTGLFIDKGFDESLTIEFMRLWNEKNTPPMKESDLEYLVHGAFQRYKKNHITDIEVFDLKKAGKKYQEFIQGLSGQKVTTGFDLVDKKLRGIMPGETCCILGKTSVGKSAFLQNIGMNYAKSSGEPVLFFSMEMPITSVFERTIQIETGLSGYEIESMFRENDAEIITHADLVFTNLPNFYTITKSGLNLESIKELTRFSEQTIYHKKTGLILVDYLGLIREEGKDIYQQVSKVARGMKDIAKDLNVPIIYLSQVTKAYSEYDELQLGAARDSGAIDEASDFILALWKEREAKQDLYPKEFTLNLGILKNRKGGLGKVSIQMDKRSLKIAEKE